MGRAGLYLEHCDIYRCEWTGLDYGNVNKDYYFVCSTRCGVDNKHGNKLVENGEVIFDTSKTFYLRHYVPVEEGYHILYKQKYYEVVSIVKDTFKNEITLNCTLVNK